MSKKIKIFFILTYLLFSYSCFSQSGWTLLQTGFTDNFTSLHFYTEMYGMAVSSSGKIIKTTNGGLDWIQLNPGIAMNFGDIRIINYTNAIAAGRQVSNKYLKILRTTNAGASWDSVYSSYNIDTNINFRNMKFSADTSGFGYVSVSKNNSGSGKYLKTVNGGLNWTNVNPHTMVYWNVLDLGMITQTVYYCFSMYTYAYQPPPVLYNEQVSWDKTTNGGSTWTVQYFLNYTTQSINTYGNFQSEFYNENIGYITYFNSQTSVYHQVIGRTTNNCQSFSEISIPVNPVSSVFLNNSSTVFLTGKLTGGIPVVAKSTNSGSNWELTVFPNAVNKIYFMNSSTGWISCNNGQLYKTTDGGILYVNNTSREVPYNYSLAQNFPNPFNPVTSIVYSIPKYSAVILAVYDALGKEVQTLVNERQRSGTYEATFDASSLSSGIYFYRLTADGYSETRKMVVLK